MPRDNAGDRGDWRGVSLETEPPKPWNFPFSYVRISTMPLFRGSPHTPYTLGGKWFVACVQQTPFLLHLQDAGSCD